MLPPRYGLPFLVAKASSSVASLLKASGPFKLPNVRRYAWFTILFNARFYYPVLAVLFLELGLTLEQFVTLNAIWAATILLAEVPSGALADLIGRRRLLILSGALMTAEMAVLLLAPSGSSWLFTFCAINRILSGLAEAAASGADEALAYDSLASEGKEDLWDDVLETTMRWRSGAMAAAVMTGALVFDASLLSQVFPVTQEQTTRFPIWLCLFQAMAVLFLSFQFQEKAPENTAGFRQIFRQTLNAGRWVLTTRSALILVLGGVIIDALARNFATITSEYYRAIHLPAWSFGLLAAGTGVLALFIPRLARLMVHRFSAVTNLTFTAAWTFLSLLALAPAWPIWGLIPAASVMAGLSFLGYFISRYLNQLADSRQRATVLSVKGLIFNLGYGAASLTFSGFVAWQRQHVDDPLLSALRWQPWAFLTAFLLYLLWTSRQKGKADSVFS